MACLRLLRTGNPFDSVDESTQIAEQTAREYFKKLTVDIVKSYGVRHLNRRQNRAKRAGISEPYAERGYNGCVGAIDCM